MAGSRRVTEVHAFLVVDPDDGRERVAWGIADGQKRPLVATHPQSLLEAELMARELVEAGARLRQVKFTRREDVREWGA